MSNRNPLTNILITNNLASDNNCYSVGSLTKKATFGHVGVQEQP